MKRFEVCFKEVNFGFATIEAETEEEAMEVAMEEYYNGNVYWHDTEVDITNLKEVKGEE